MQGSGTASQPSALVEIGAMSSGAAPWLELGTFGDLLVRGADRHPDRDCLVLGAERRTYAELLEGATARARTLHALGVERGQRVGILLANSVEFVETLFAVAFTGAASVPLNVRFRPRELEYVLADAQLAVLVTGEGRTDPAGPVAAVEEVLAGLRDARDPKRLALEAAPGLRAVWCAEGAARPGTIDASIAAALADSVSPERIVERRRGVAVRDPAIMFYTSGTTAMPKGCLLTHEALVRIGTVAARYRMHLEEGARCWDPLPMFHTAFTQMFVGAIDAGGTYLTARRFDAGEALEQIQRERATVMFAAFPTIAMALLNHPNYDPDRLRSVRTVFNVAPPDVLRIMQAKMPHSTQISAFGLSEFGGSVVMNDRDEDLETRLGDQGLPLPGIEVTIRDPVSGDRLGPGQHGEIALRGPTCFEGYWRDVAKTAAVVDDDGWVRTGDLGSLSGRGGLRFEGRLKDMLKVGGENVAALEIESFVATHPSVSIVAVVGIPHARYGEVAAAFVELNPGMQASEEEIVEFARDGLAWFKVPRHVRFVAEWPMSSTKIQKFVLRDELLAELGDEAAG